MTIIVNNHHYLIRFTHHHLSSEIRAYRRKKAKYTGEEWTTCIIEQVNPDSGELLGGYWDQAFCSLTDQFSKSMGRRLSLSRVLRVMFSREERTLAWAAIWKERRKMQKQHLNPDALPLLYEAAKAALADCSIPVGLQLAHAIDKANQIAPVWSL